MADIKPPARQGHHAWHRDVLVQTTPVLTTTGGTVWGAAHRAMDFCETMQEEMGLTRPGIRILELGAGCGLLGMVLARNLPFAGEVCLTEQAFGGALGHLRVNVEANRGAGMPGIGSVTTAACDWTKLQLAEGAVGGCGEEGGSEAIGCGGSNSGDEGGSSHDAGGHGPATGQYSVAECCDGELQGRGDDNNDADDTARLMSKRWDIIIGSDLVYNKAGTHLLPRVMKALALAGPRSLSDPEAGGPFAPSGDPGTNAAAPIYYAHTKHRYDICDMHFFEQCQAVGLSVLEVREPGVPTPPPSPPPLTELFPEMRCAVYKITVCNEEH